MSTERFANDAVTTLSSAVNDSTTTIPLTSTSLFPAAGYQVHIKIDSEIIVGFVGTNELVNCTRGVDGTTAASHADDSDVTLVLTNESLTRLATGIYQRGANAPINEMVEFATTATVGTQVNAWLGGTSERYLNCPTTGMCHLDLSVHFTCQYLSTASTGGTSTLNGHGLFTQFIAYNPVANSINAGSAINVYTNPGNMLALTLTTVTHNTAGATQTAFGIQPMFVNTYNQSGGTVQIYGEYRTFGG